MENRPLILDRCPYGGFLVLIDRTFRHEIAVVCRLVYEKVLTCVDPEDLSSEGKSVSFGRNANFLRRKFILVRT